MSDEEFQAGLGDFVRFVAENRHLFAMSMMLLSEHPAFEQNDGFDRFLAATLNPVEIGE